MWRALCKRGTGEIVCDNVKDKTGIIFLSISLLQKLLFTACFCLCASARRVCYVSLHVLRICWCGPFSWQTPSTLDLSTCSASARGAGLSLTLVQLSLTHSCGAVFHSHRHPSDICLCVCHGAGVCLS